MSNCTYIIEYLEMSLYGSYSKCIRSKVYTVSKLFPAPCCIRRKKISGYVCSVLSPVCLSGKHAFLCSPSKIHGGGRGRGLFMLTFLQRLIENNMWKLGSPARQRATVCIVRREDSSFRPVDATKKKEASTNVSRESRVPGRLKDTDIWMNLKISR